MQHLVGCALPDLALPNCTGGQINPKRMEGSAVYFCYPYTGRPGYPDPRGWDDIIGAHGSTPQALAYARLHNAFVKLKAKVFGVSLLPLEWLTDFSQRNDLQYDLLSDFENNFSQAMNLQRFSIDGVDYLQRITIIAVDGEIRHVEFPVVEPELDAARTLTLLL